MLDFRLADSIHDRLILQVNFIDVPLFSIQIVLLLLQLQFKLSHDPSSLLFQALMDVFLSLLLLFLDLPFLEFCALNL